MTPGLANRQLAAKVSAPMTFFWRVKPVPTWSWFETGRRPAAHGRPITLAPLATARSATPPPERELEADDLAK
jgi:hypothetical protein